MHDYLEPNPWEANTSLASQKIPQILWNPKVISVFTKACHLSVFRCSWIHSMLNYLSFFLFFPLPPQIHFNYPHLYLGLPSSLQHLCFPAKILYMSSMLATRPAQLILDLITQILGNQLQTMKLSLGNFLQSPVTSVLLGSCIFLTNLFLNTLRPYSSLIVIDNVLHPHEAKDNFLYTLMLRFQKVNGKRKDSGLNDTRHSRN